MITGAIKRTLSLNMEAEVSTIFWLDFSQAFERTLLKFIELVRRAILERKIRNKAVSDIFLLRANHPA